jgi:hypothetical protein
MATNASVVWIGAMYRPFRGDHGLAANRRFSRLPAAGSAAYSGNLCYSASRHATRRRLAFTLLMQKTCPMACDLRDAALGRANSVVDR